MREALVPDSGDVVDEDRDQGEPAPEVDGVGLAWHRKPRIGALAGKDLRPISQPDRNSSPVAVPRKPGWQTRGWAIGSRDALSSRGASFSTRSAPAAPAPTRLRQQSS